jgi:hypothetical protein
LITLEAFCRPFCQNPRQIAADHTTPSMPRWGCSMDVRDTIGLTRTGAVKKNRSAEKNRKILAGVDRPTVGPGGCR